MANLRPLPGETRVDAVLRVRAQTRERVKRLRARKLRIDYYPSVAATRVILRYLPGCEGPTAAINELVLAAGEARRRLER